MEAIEIYNQIITEYGLGRGGDIALTYLNLGYLNRCTKQWEKAITYYQESINIFNKSFEEGIVREKVSVIQFLSRNYVGIGYCQRVLKQFDNALSCFKKAVEVIGEHFNEDNKIVLASDYSTALNECAWSLYKMDDSLKAEPFANRAVDIIRLLPESKNPLRMFLDTLAYIHRELGKYAESESEFLESLTIAEDLYSQNAKQNAYCLYNELKELAFLYFEMKDQAKFNQYKTKALQYYNELNEETKKERYEDFKKLESLVLT